MSYHAISSKIIKEAISAAVYIDDKVLLPFEDKKEGLINQSDLFYSFRESNCYVDFNRHEKDQTVDYATLLNNKDLLILDWHLSDDRTDLSATFEILRVALNTQCLHFCVIYTDQRAATLPQDVILNVASYFSGLDKRMVTEGLEAFKQFLDATGLSQEEQDSFTESLKGLTTELFFELRNKARNKAISKEIDTLITSVGSRDDFAAFLNGLRLPYDLFKEKLACLCFVLNRSDVPEAAQTYKMSLSADRITIRINSLYIKVFSKDITDSELYREFTTSLVSESNIFLTLLGLEIRNRFRETSGFIGKDLDDINQLAFFHHRGTHFEGQETLFNEFLKDIWKDQVASFLLEKEIELFAAIDEFKADNDIENKLTTFHKGDPASVTDLAKLNLVYNRLAIIRKENDEIRFGDVFLLRLEDSMVYLLCLTPLCDCLRPGKINNMFFFVEGTDIGKSKGVEKSDGDYISYLEKDNGELTCIDWTNGAEDCKPFSFYVRNNHMMGADKNVSLNYRGNDKEAQYLCTLKENYAQRIANKAFFYPLRVGIDFATFKTKTNP